MPKTDKIFAQLVFLAIFRSRTTFDSKPQILNKSQGVKSGPKYASKSLIILVFKHARLPYYCHTPSGQKITEKWAQNDPFFTQIIAYL